MRVRHDAEFVMVPVRRGESQLLSFALVGVMLIAQVNENDETGQWANDRAR